MELVTIVVNFFQAGGIFMYPIVITLAVGTAIIIERMVYLARANVSGKTLWLKVRKALVEGKVKEAIQACQFSKAPLCQILRLGIEKFQGTESHQELRNSLEETILEEVPALEQRTHYLPTLANVSTLMGLLGTIIGLIQAP